MGTLKCGFWNFRFLISPEEFEAWAEQCTDEGFAFYSTVYDRPPIDRAAVCSSYRAFFEARMHTDTEVKSVPLVCYELVKPDFVPAFQITSQEFTFYPPDRPPLPLTRTKLYLELSAPKQYAVPCDDGVHFEYGDILEKQPDAKAQFDRISGTVKKITKSLQYQGRTAYSVRISRAAWQDLSQSALIRGTGVGLSCAWK